MTTFSELLPILTTYSEVSEKQTQKTLELNVPVELSLATGGRGSGAHAPQQLTLTVADDGLWVQTTSPPPCGDGLARLWLVGLAVWIRRCLHRELPACVVVR